MEQTLVSVRSLTKYFPIKRGMLGKSSHLKAVDHVRLDIRKGEILGLVGESGCGKTTLGRLILRLIDPMDGNIIYEGLDLTTLRGHALKNIRKEMQIIFQDPFASLNPRMRVGKIIGRNIKIHNILHGHEVSKRVDELLTKVGLRPDFANRYPHEFSGGQRQRIAIARALATEPKLIIADEPTSALDVSVQAQILNLMKMLQRSLGLSILFISHNISVIKHISDRVAVMYLGKIVEIGTKIEFFEKPLHPYTFALLSSVPLPNPKIKMQEVPLEGEVPSPINPPSGCIFHPRCISRMPKCSESEPKTKIIGNREVACFLY
jgi:oligopeptide/dipeptide ABC transporter ATP-binding protein